MLSKGTEAKPRNGPHHEKQVEQGGRRKVEGVHGQSEESARGEGDRRPPHFRRLGNFPLALLLLLLLLFVVVVRCCCSLLLFVVVVCCCCSLLFVGGMKEKKREKESVSLVLWVLLLLLLVLVLLVLLLCTWRSWWSIKRVYNVFLDPFVERWCS